MNTTSSFSLAMTAVLSLLVPVACVSEEPELECYDASEPVYEPPHFAPSWAAELIGDWDFDEHPVADAGSCGRTEGQFQQLAFRIPASGRYVAAVARPQVDSVLSLRRLAPDQSCEDVLACLEIPGAPAEGMGGASGDEDASPEGCVPFDVVMVELGLGGAAGTEEFGLEGCFPTELQVSADFEAGDEVVVTLAAVSAEEADGVAALYFFSDE